jgi:hypothetical protein
MKLQNIFRMQAIVIGFGAVLLLSTPVKAQEIVNTEFSDGPSVTSFTQPAAITTEAAATAPSAVQVKAETPVATNPQLASMDSSIEGWLFGSSLFGVALIAIYAIAEVRRANRNLRVRPSFTRRVVLS